MKQIYKNILVLFLVLSSTLALATDFPPWDVPAEEQAIENPVEKDKKVIDAGAALYKMQCAACHGPKAMGDGLIPAANLTTEAFLAQTDGAIFYKIMHGRGQMPAFKALPENDIWGIIHYLRDLSSGANEGPKRTGQLEVKLSDKNGTKTASVNVTEVLEDGSVIPVADIKVGVYIKRYFGDLPVSSAAMYSDKEGNVMVTFPDDIPGDEQGSFDVVVKLEDSGFDAVEKTESITWGTIKPESNWDESRALWRPNTNLPWWVILSFLGITGGVWLGIFYVLLLVKKIKDASKA